MTRLAAAGKAAMAWWSHRVGRPRLVQWPLSTVRVMGPFQATRSGLVVWFRLGGQHFDFLTLDERIGLWDQLAFRLGSLAATSDGHGCGFQLRVTTRPYPAFEYARSLDLATDAPLAQVPGGESWDDYLEKAQRRLHHTLLDQKLVMVGIRIGPNPPPEVWEDLHSTTTHPGLATVRLLEQVQQLEQLMAGPGLDARVVTPPEMAFLFHRSLSMGVPSPRYAAVGVDGWAPDDMAAFTHRRLWTANRFGSTVRVTSEAAGTTVDRYVAVVSMAAVPDLTWPDGGRDPWLVVGDRLGIPLEWSINGMLVKPGSLADVVQGEQWRAEGIARHYLDHRETPPASVARAIATAHQNLDALTEGDPRMEARFVGTIRAATWADTETEAVAQAARLVDEYGEKCRMELVHTRDQASILREFVPGEPRAKVGFQRRLPVRYLAGAMPHVNADLGTPTGPYLGYGTGSARRAARFDLHYGPEQLNSPGLFPIVGEPGSGKSVLIGTLAYNAVRAGEPTIILDPSGPLARLTELLELAPYSRVLDLTSSEPGTLSPYGLIPEPRFGPFTSPAGVLNEMEWERACRRAAAERQQLMLDVIHMWLPDALLRAPGVDALIRTAMRQVHDDAKRLRVPSARVNPRWVIDQLERMPDPLAKQLAAELGAAAEFPLGELVIPPHAEVMPDTQLEDATLVVVTMPGLQPPPEGVDRAHWGSEERYTQPLLHLAAFYTSRFIYTRPRTERKNVFLDENHLMGRWGSGRAFFVRLSTDSRKYNVAVGAASQHPDDHLTIGRLDALMGSALVGRLTNHDAATKACQLLGCDPQYASVIQALSPKHATDGNEIDTGEFVWRDPLGRVGRLRVDFDWHPALRQALHTTPGRPRPDQPMRIEPAPFLDPDLYGPISPITHQEAAA